MNAHSLFPAPASETFLLVQNRNGTETRLTLSSDNSLKIETKSKKHQQSFSMDVGVLAPNPTRESAKSGWFNGRVFYFFCATVFFSIPMALSLYLDAFGAAVAFGLFGPLPLAILSAVEIRKQMRKGYDVCIYHSRFGGGAALVIESNTPDVDSVARFRSELDRRIELSSNAPVPLSAHDSISAQILDLHRLVKEGILTEDEFSVVKARLLSQADRVERKIGFTASDVP